MKPGIATLLGAGFAAEFAGVAHVYPVLANYAHVQNLPPSRGTRLQGGMATPGAVASTRPPWSEGRGTNGGPSPSYDGGGEGVDEAQVPNLPA
jgi:hypothetical protein